MTGTTRMRLAVDIGGANTKAAWFDGELVRTLTRPFEVWRDREALVGVLREVGAGPADAVAITMTAELSDAFRTKREGVSLVLDAAQAAFGDRPLSVLTTAGELVTVAFPRERIARLVCSDLEQLGERDVAAIAAFLYGEQLRQIEEAARRAQLHADAPVV